MTRGGKSAMACSQIKSLSSGRNRGSLKIVRYSIKYIYELIGGVFLKVVVNE